LLWFGWYGFNAGSELQVDSITAPEAVTVRIRSGRRINACTQKVVAPDIGLLFMASPDP